MPGMLKAAPGTYSVLLKGRHIVTASIILPEDHVLVRQGLRRIIQEEPGMQVTSEVGDGLDLLELLKNNTPDVVILDISMPRLKGLEAAEIIKAQYPQVKIMILTMHREKYLFERAMEIGVDAYVLKDEADIDLTRALKAVLAGEKYVSPLVLN
jgi:DNA-binding NarL/FixJ family response regulator